MNFFPAFHTIRFRDAVQVFFAGRADPLLRDLQKTVTDRAPGREKQICQCPHAKGLSFIDISDLPAEARIAFLFIRIVDHLHDDVFRPQNDHALLCPRDTRIKQISVKSIL